MEPPSRSPTSPECFEQDLQGGRSAGSLTDTVPPIMIEPTKVADVYMEPVTTKEKEKLPPAARLPAEVIEQ